MNSSIKAVPDWLLVSGGAVSAILVTLISVGMANGAGGDMASGLGMALYFLLALFVGLPSGVVALAKAIGYLAPTDRNVSKACLMFIVAFIGLASVGLMLWQFQTKYHIW